MADPGTRLPPPVVEAAGLAVGFSTALRRAGLAVPPDRAARLAEAIRLVPPFERDALYWTSRVVLVSRHEQLPLFDAVFAAIFDGMLDPADSRGDSAAPPPIGGEIRTRPTARDERQSGTEASPQEPTMSPGGDSEGGAGPEREAILAMASSEEHLHDVAFAELAGDEVAEMRRLVRKIVLATPTRRSRRTRRTPHRSARLDLRRTVRSAHRTGGDSIRLIYSQRRTRSRRLVLLCDVSASMEPYTRVFLSLLQGSVVDAGAEAFVFSTRLTRLTRQLAVRNPDEALARAASAASDWAGGTRLAESIRSFINDHGRRGLARGAVIVVLSDGWAQDAPELVGKQMARLSRLAHRIVWVNPRKVAVGYRPLVGGMAAALPYCDAFVSGHSYTALTEVAAAIRADRPSQSERNRGPDNATR